MMKKVCAAALILAICLAMLAGCGNSSDKKSASELSVSVRNSSGYIFNELYVSPSASTEWGDDHLGSTSILKKGGSFDLTLTAYDFNTYDIRVVDEDEDIYLFERVPLESGCEIDIVWENELAASVSYEENDDVFIVGNFVSGNGGGGGDVVTSADWLEMVFFNNSTWDFYEVYVYESGSSDYGYNHIASTSLYAGEEVEIGVDYYDYYDIELLDEDDDTWYFTGVVLTDDSYVVVDWDNDNILLTVHYSDGGTYESVGTFL